MNIFTLLSRNTCSHKILESLESLEFSPRFYLANFIRRKIVIFTCISYYAFKCPTFLVSRSLKINGNYMRLLPCTPKWLYASKTLRSQLNRPSNCNLIMPSIRFGRWQTIIWNMYTVYHFIKSNNTYTCHNIRHVMRRMWSIIGWWIIFIRNRRFRKRNYTRYERWCFKTKAESRYRDILIPFEHRVSLSLSLSPLSV